MLAEPVKQKLLQKYQELKSAGELLADHKRDQYQAEFRSRFGPDQLSKLNGEALLEAMHGRSGKESMAYWLEFKKDDDFATDAFGGIGGGSALKFGLFRRKETGNWEAAGAGGKPEEISVDQAVEIARKQRDQLLIGVELLNKLSVDASDDEYRSLQAEMDRLAPDVSQYGWGHKYLHLIFPDRLDDFHNPEYQRFYLTKLLQTLPPEKGRYVCAGRYVAITKELGVSLGNLTHSLYMTYGPKRPYWRVGTSDGTQPRNHWEMMRNGNCVAIGWPDLGDLSTLDPTAESKEALRKHLEEKYPTTPQAIGKARNQITMFVLSIQPNDYVLACDGGSILGIAKVLGGYEYDPTSDFPHRRAVEWLSLEEWRMPNAEGLQTTVYEMHKFPENILETERRIQNAPKLPPPPPGPKVKIGPVPQLDGIKGQVQAVLEHKGQVILHGPPGTGKTYWAEKAAHDLAAYPAFGKFYEQLAVEQQNEVRGNGVDGLVRMCCFHPAYGYEDFIEGYRPELKGDGLGFVLRPGIFKQICRDAEQKTDKRFFLIIDEINRGDIPRIFGELLTVLEKDKREKKIILPLSREEFSVPRNVFIIGTMNTADRSISLLDAALRRRFGFVELMPTSSLFESVSIEGIPVAPWLDALNARICENVGKDARNLQIGHSYLFYSGKPIMDMATFKRSLQYEILPLLEEYCYQDSKALQGILGLAFMNSDHRTIRKELFQDGRESDLVQALLAPCPEIAASTPALAMDQEVTDEQNNEDDEGEEK